MGTYRVAAIIRSFSDSEKFIIARQPPPPKFDDAEYDSYVDSHLWDLPSSPLNSILLQPQSQSSILLQGFESCSDHLNLRDFDLDCALNQVLAQVGLRTSDVGHWRFWKYMEEPDFGPGAPVQTLFVTGKLVPEDQHLPEVCKWTSPQTCLDMLAEVKPSNDRVGPLVVVGLLTDSTQSASRKVPSSLQQQEYPPGVLLIPMGSKTGKPFRTTNLVVFAPNNVDDNSGDGSFIAHGDALIVDPGCQTEFHKELKEIIAVLPRKLVVFLTHHHRDHTDGLSVVQTCNPDAILVAHENTMHRVGEGDWSRGFTSVSGGEEINIGGQRLRVIFAPGHTDGHTALLHVSTHSLIVGDHCVGQGSAVLDITSGGNMTEYFQTTYNFLELSPHALIPMHGRVNLWPKHMLCGYLKNRRRRESSILTAIENGATTLIDIVATAYSDVDKGFWFLAASNVRLHVDHLAKQDKLPKAFSLDAFSRSWVEFAENYMNKL